MGKIGNLAAVGRYSNFYGRCDCQPASVFGDTFSYMLMFTFILDRNALEGHRPDGKISTVCADTCTYTAIRRDISMHARACVRMCLFACLFVRMFVCTCVRTYLCIVLYCNVMSCNVMQCNVM